MLEVAFRNCHAASEYADMEASFRRRPGVLSVHVDRTRGVAHLGYAPGVVSSDQLSAAFEASGYGCDCQDCASYLTQPGHPRQMDGHDHASHEERRSGLSDVGHHARSGAEHGEINYRVLAN